MIEKSQFDADALSLRGAGSVHQGEHFPYTPGSVDSRHLIGVQMMSELQALPPVYSPGSLHGSSPGPATTAAISEMIARNKFLEGKVVCTTLTPSLHA